MHAGELEMQPRTDSGEDPLDADHLQQRQTKVLFGFVEFANQSINQSVNQPIKESTTQYQHRSSRPPAAAPDQDAFQLPRINHQSASQSITDTFPSLCGVPPITCSSAQPSCLWLLHVA